MIKLTKEFIATETTTLRDVVQAFVKSHGTKPEWERFFLKRILLLRDKFRSPLIDQIFFGFLEIMKLYANCHTNKQQLDTLELRRKNEALFFDLDQWKQEATQSLLPQSERIESHILSMANISTAPTGKLNSSPQISTGETKSTSNNSLIGDKSNNNANENNENEWKPNTPNNNTSNIFNRESDDLNNSSTIEYNARHESYLQNYNNSHLAHDVNHNDRHNNDNNNFTIHNNFNSSGLGASSLSDSSLKTGNKDLDDIAFTLKQDGFSPTSIEQMINEFKEEKLKLEELQKKMEDNKIRLRERMIQYNFKEKSVIPEDGNCQFSSISDQTFGDIDSHGYWREQAVEWILKNKDCVLPNGSCLKNYIYDFESVEKFCEDMSKPGIWGNHLTLVALSELTGRKIVILSSVASSANCLMEILPKVIKDDEQGPIFLSHYAEYHYGSLCKID